MSDYAPNLLPFLIMPVRVASDYHVNKQGVMDSHNPASSYIHASPIVHRAISRFPKEKIVDGSQCQFENIEDPIQQQIEKIQIMLTRIASYPGVTQSTVFQISAPVLAFAYALYVSSFLRSLVSSADCGLLTVSFAAGAIAGLLVTLAGLRALIWATASAAQMLIEWDSVKMVPGSLGLVLALMPREAIQAERKEAEKKMNF
jgi:hypothetical protein